MGKVVEIAIPVPAQPFAVVVPDSKKIEAVTKVVGTKEPIKVGRVETESYAAKIEMAEVKSEELVAHKKECGVVIESKSDVEAQDSLPEKVKEDGGMRVASRTKNGVTVMKIKE
ncbi:MAG: hypothetical protein HQK96_18950 [Nitrospirae bacterium]|nr:hypothetical protein [Nitrospirota bacterium]